MANIYLTPDENSNVERPPLEPAPNPQYNPPPSPPPNLGPAEGSGGSYTSAPAPLSPADERTWAMISHLGVLANLVTGFLGPIIPLIIYIVYRERSRYVAYQSLQAFVFQMIWWVGGGFLATVAWAISGALAVILVGCLLMPFALLISLLPIGALVYGVIGALQTNEGKDFRYWLIGDWLRSTYTGA